MFDLVLTQGYILCKMIWLCVGLHRIQNLPDIRPLFLPRVGVNGAGEKNMKNESAGGKIKKGKRKR